MSITKDFENKSLRAYEFGIADAFVLEDVMPLLAHARALEAMLKKHRGQWNHPHRRYECLECSRPIEVCDCELSKLIEGVEPAKPES